MEQATKTLEDANRQALLVINGEKMDVFAENANYEAYRISKDTGIGYGFSVYDKDTVGKLIREQPELMPRKVVNGKKDRAWNRTKISNAVAQSIIQGDSLPEMTERIARVTAHDNDAAMARYAATAMTSAQNAGRMETMQRAKGIGIKVRKKWIATLDARTRDSHAELDGQVVDIDEPFITHNRDGSLAEIMFPGDPQADGEQVWNCRCTLGYVYEEYPDEEDAERIAAEYYRDEDDNLRQKPKYIKNISYSEWKKQKREEQTRDEAEPEEKRESDLERKVRNAGKEEEKEQKPKKEEFAIPEKVRSSITRQSASDDWFEYENANLMSEYIRTGIMPRKNMYMDVVEDELRQRLAAEAEMIQSVGERTKTAEKTLFRGMVMQEDEIAGVFKKGEVYTFDTLAAATPDRKIAGIYMDVDNAGGEGVSVIVEMQKPDGIYGFKRDDLETVLPKGSEFRVERVWKDDEGTYHVSLYAKKGKKNVKGAE